MDKIGPEFHNRRCRVYTDDLEKPLRGIVAVAKPDAKVIMVDDKAVLRTSITRIELDTPDSD